MSGYQEIKKQLLPLVKGLPIVLGIFLISLFIARQVIRYSPIMYRTMAKIKLDQQKHGFSGNNLYEDFDVFSGGNKTAAEAEILKSPLIVGQAIESLNLDLVIYRKGKIKNTMLYNDSPILIDYDFSSEKLYDRFFNLDILEDESVRISLQIEGEETVYEGKLGIPVNVGLGTITIKKNIELILLDDLQLTGSYQFKVFSKDRLISDLVSRLDVVAVDKEIAVLRIVYTDEHPQKAADFTNALCKAYSQDYIETKSNAARQTSQFIDDKLSEVGKKLADAERDLESFKRTNKVVNTRQETETGLREISKLKIQLMNLEMNEKAIIELQSYIESGEYFDETAINFGFGDLLMTELVKKMKLWQDERLDLLSKYTENHESVIAVNAKIEEIRRYIKEALKQNLKEIRTKRAMLERDTDVAESQFEGLPSREKRQMILERNFRLQEGVYNFLSQKKIEASIAASALLSFHRTIQPAVVPKEPISPNKTLITFVSGLLGLILGIAFIYLRQYALARVTSRDDLERNSALPVAGIIRSNDEEEDFQMLNKSLLLKELIKPGQTISLASTLSEEGKSYVAYHLSKSLLNQGYSVCLVDANPKNPQQFETPQSWDSIQSSNNDCKYAVVSSNGFVGNGSAKLKKLNERFDFVVVDSPASAVDVRGVELIKAADLTLYIVRANHTCLNYLAQADLLAEEYKLQNVHLILNDASKTTNYSGSFVGSRFRYGVRPEAFVERLKYYFQTYVFQ